MSVFILNVNELVQEVIFEKVNLKMFLILFLFGDGVTDTQQLLSIVQMSLRILNVNYITF